MTLRKRYVRFFVQGRGYTEIESRSRKYIALCGKEAGGVSYIFLGRNGAVRRCKTNTATKSVDISMYIKNLIERWEKDKGYTK